MRFKILASAIALGSLFSVSCGAVTIISAANRVDMVHDAKRGLVYVTNGTEVLRYDVASGTLLSPIELGGQLSGLDLSPDQDTLVVADHASSETDAWVYVVPLDTLTPEQVTVTKDFMEGGIFTAVYGADGNIYTTSTFEGSGWVPFRRLDVSNGQWTELASVRQDTMLTPSGDAETIAFAEANISDGRWGLYDIPTGQLVQRQWYTDGTSWFNYEIGTDRYGTQFAIPTYGGTFVYNDTYQKIGTLGVYADAQPIGVAYHPVEEIAYFPWTPTNEVRVYDMRTLAQIGAYDFGIPFGPVYNWAFVQGRTRLSRDGSLLMVTTDGGVGLQQMYAPLHAENVPVATGADQPIDVPLQGSIGNAGALSYDLATPPTHGAIMLSGGVATYTPAPGYIGSDSFVYSVHYGRAVAAATVDISVGALNHPPLAYGQSINASEDTAAAIVLQATDTDADPLTYSIVLAPQHGSLTGSGSYRVYTPAPDFNGFDSFAFIADDGKTSSNVATVSISVASANDAPVAYGQTLSGDEDAVLPITLQAADVDGDSLSYSIVAAPQHGTLSGSGAARTYTPAANYHGTDSFTFIASDGHVSSNAATINITVASVNDAPVAVLDISSTPRNTAVSIPVLANDSDADGDALAIVSVSHPANGTAAISGTKIVYTPAKGYTGSDQFTYSITDGHGGTASANVTVAVAKK